MKLLLKLKSWQLFCLLIGIPLVGQLLLGSFFPKANDPLLNMIFPTTIFTYILGIVTFFWFWGLGMQLNQSIEKKLCSSSWFFQLGIIYPMLYLIGTLVIITTSSNNSSMNFNAPYFIASLVPFLVLYLFFMLYSMYFISKNLLLAEKHTEMKIEDLLVPFFALWFFPVGIWFLQPRINKLYEGNSE